MAEIGLSLVTGTLGRSAWLRWTLLTLARAGGALKRWARTGCVRVAILYTEAAVLVVLYNMLASPGLERRWRAFLADPAIVFRPALLSESIRWFFAGVAGPWVVSVGVAALLLTLGAAWRARKRIVVMSFVNLTGDDTRKVLTDSLPRRLSNQLSDIADVFTHVSDDPAGLSIEHGFPALALAVDPAAGVFAGLKASVKDQTVKVGFLNLPLDGAVTALSTLVQGPQITGSVQTTSRGLLLEASLSGGGFNLNWRVDECDVNADRAGKEPDAAIVDRMICQLGYRIFTDLNYEQTGTREWRAAEHYVEGLRAFRTWRRQGNSTEGLIALQRAQKEFLAACPEDRAFMRSRYNLGVIYSYQQVNRAAYAIFEEAINSTAGAATGLPGTASYKRERGDLASAHYAAAVAANGLGRSDRVQYHCALALKLNPWHAGAWRVQAEVAKEQSEQRAPGLRRACAISWWNLCRAVWARGARAIEVSRAAGYAAAWPVT